MAAAPLLPRQRAVVFYMVFPQFPSPPDAFRGTRCPVVTVGLPSPLINPKLPLLLLPNHSRCVCVISEIILLNGFPISCLEIFHEAS